MSANSVPAGIDPDLWETMTEEERAGITGEGLSDADKTALAAVAGSGGEGGGDDDDDDDDSGGTAAAAAGGDDKGGESAGGKAAEAGNDGGAAAAEPGAAAPAPTTAQPDPVIPVYKVDLPADYDQRVAANKEAKDSAWAKFDSGDLTREELQAELSRLDIEGRELHDLKLKANIASEMTAQTAEQQWTRAVQRNTAEFAKPEHGGIDYAKDDAKRADLDHFVKALANDPKNEDKGMDWFLQEAHKRVRALHGLAEPPKPRDTPAAANERRKPDLKAVPPNLSQVPGGDGPGDVAGEFADVDGLEGVELEEAIARMTPAQRERYSMGR